MSDEKTRRKRSWHKSRNDHSSSKPNCLPIANYREHLIAAVQDNQFLVVVGETGSGKTTQLPQYLFNAGLVDHGRMIGITQPRRIAAMSVASRVAEETNTQIGG